MSRGGERLRSAALPFRRVNRPNAPGHRPDLQKHHLLPRQLLMRQCFAPMFEALGFGAIGFDDFRRNGMLLPASEKAALRAGLPLHRGPHVTYNEMVTERVGQIELTWTDHVRSNPEQAMRDALMRLELLQRALRKRLLTLRRESSRLNRFDPLGAGRDFSQLDAIADALWGATAVAAARPVASLLEFDRRGR